LLSSRASSGIGAATAELLARQGGLVAVTKQGNMSAEDVANAILFALKQPANVNVREIWLAPTAAVR
jgi:NADP-dependent 3-hydroxy acid dehydrogenase YdfG